MSKIPTDLRYAMSHEWARSEADGTVTVGLSDHAQKDLGEIWFVDTRIGTVLAKGDIAGLVESVEAVLDVCAPIGGEVIAVNGVLDDRPESINTDPYGAWIFKLKPSNRAELDELLDAAGYRAAVYG
ncbi:glycine cleavage system protein GcvH [Kitasatospora atroaurantiaca]|uniref:Glycine cleavage system H protein n=2 Tax=Kitasatospora atroaurantiaca TaxID=285545 RepID=A0A561F1T3_9ACTN|nr:glycine cleavage system H protein [Kitasatospora atroaurantiaca]TWE21827.1 glycine cleavage system H protein [Kitasatospora atroaurantiaca]